MTCFCRRLYFTSLEILYDGYKVGLAIPDGARFSLEYDEGWKRLEFAFPLSRSLPLTGGPYPPNRAHPFFANLLPEGLSRQATCERLGISVDNDIELEGYRRKNTKRRGVQGTLRLRRSYGPIHHRRPRISSG